MSELLLSFNFQICKALHFYWWFDKYMVRFHLHMNKTQAHYAFFYRCEYYTDFTWIICETLSIVSGF